jgi:HK97 family phage portal protein
MRLLDYFAKKQQQPEQLHKVTFTNNGKQIIVKTEQETLATIETSQWFKHFGFSFGGLLDDDTAIQDGYLSNPDIYANIKKIATVTSSIPRKLMVRDKEITKGDLYERFILKANAKQTWRKFIYEGVTYMLATGDLFIRLQIDMVGFPPSYKILPSQLVTPYKRLYDIDEPVMYYEYRSGATYERIDPSEIIHIQLFNPSTIGQSREDGLSPIAPARHLMNASNNLAVADSSIFENGGANTLVAARSVELPITSTDLEALKKGIQSSRGGAESFGKLIPIQTAIDIHRIGLTPEELDMFEAHKRHLRGICRVFGTSAVLFGDAEGSIYDNVTSAEKSLYNDVSIPILQDIIEEAIWPYLPDNTDLIIDNENIEALNPSPAERREMRRKEVVDGIISPDEFREEFGYSPLGGEFAVPRTRQSQVTVNNNGKEN